MAEYDERFTQLRTLELRVEALTELLAKSIPAPLIVLSESESVALLYVRLASAERERDELRATAGRHIWPESDDEREIREGLENGTLTFAPDGPVTLPQGWGELNGVAIGEHCLCCPACRKQLSDARELLTQIEALPHVDWRAGRKLLARLREVIG